LPNIQKKIARPIWIKVQAQNLDGQQEVFEARDLLARVIQHEVDHLDGILII